VDANNFYIASAIAATSSAGPTSMNSGNASLQYYIGSGPIQGATGWGVSGWGVGGWGSGVASTQQGGTPVSPTDWTISNWGEDLVACPKNGTLYYWGPESGTQTLIPIPNAPSYNAGMMIAMPQLIMVAWGSTATLGLGVAQDPLLVKWSDAGNFTTWTALNSNLAGDQRLSRGSLIVGGFQSTFRTLLWTDIECWSMDYIGYPYTFSFNVIGTNCGLIGRGAVGELGGQVFWVSPSNIFVLSGNGVRPLPCPVYDTLFQDLDTTNAWKMKIGVNPAFNEFFIFYPSAAIGTGENSKYIKYNIAENAWDAGTLGRTAWLGQSILGSPIGSGSDNVLYQHEVGYNANSSPLSPSWTTGWFTLSDGEDFPFVDQFMPDMRWGTLTGSAAANVQFTFYGVDNLGDTPYVYGPYTANSTTQYIPVRIRNRYLSISATSSDYNTFWRLGRPKFRIAQSGRR
jgi:hypothetical protein